MADPHTRPIPAPVQEWLTRKELCNALDVGESFLAAAIKAGRFPRGTRWDNKEDRWPWQVVVWFRLFKLIEPMLATEPVDEPEPDVHPEKSIRK